MTKKMLIDAAHPEEVRVCVLEHGKVEDFDFEYATRKPLRGNIYLARVTRVEPSLQAAFVEYGGNRHGFLAFNEIHADYYQIPISDRRILQEAEAEEAALADELELGQRGDEGEDGELALDGDEGGARFDDLAGDEDDSPGVTERPARAEASEADDADTHGESEDEPAETADDPDADDSDDEPVVALAAEPLPETSALADDADSDEADEEPDTDDHADETDGADIEAADEDPDADEDANGDVDGDADGDADGAGEDKPARSEPVRGAKRAELMERYREARRKRVRIMRNYKIQEVIKRRQILLVQVVKEERGNKGAALTTYMSLAGRYCVLMPNTARGGGISRKIPVASDRKRLRRVVDGLELPQGMGLIIRTAGAKRTKAEIKRDYDYLIRLWENIRALTLKSIAPSLIYEEANLIKRAIRDLYDKDIDQITVEGDAGYREAKDFMKMLMPSHAKNVQPYKERTPLFLKYDVESQLDAMFQPMVRLKSGGYLVIHQTEALIAIDVNSGKATRERNIELTALKTNLEAAKEASRQCRLRDLAGLIVIDFIDMEEHKNNRAVEKRLKDSLKDDRARIQVGRISNFGLLEMSRQRRRSGIVDGTTHACPTCAGAGVVRSHEMAALRILRGIESSALTDRSAVITVKAGLEVTLYILNHKRSWLRRIEDDYAVTVEVFADTSKAGDQYDLEKHGAPRDLPEAPAFIRADQPELEDEPEADAEIEAMDADEDDESEASEEKSESGAQVAEGEGAPGGRRRRRRRRRGRRDDAGAPQEQHARADTARDAAPDEDADASDTEEEAAEPRSAGEGPASEEGADGQRRRRRRGRRGGRRNNRRPDQPMNGDQPALSADGPQPELGDFGDEDREDAPAPSETASEPAPAVTYVEPVEDETPEPVAAYAPPAEESRDEPEEQPEPRAPRDPKSQRKGWWQRAIGG